jgi:quaternary ammonium compound-resistance protein SugE
MAWLYLFLAAVCQTVWTYSLKAADFKALASFTFTGAVLGPVLLNIVAGLANVFFLNRAFQTLPLATAFGIWTALTLIFIKLTDVLLYKAPWSGMEVFFIGLLALSIIGLRLAGSQSV